MNKLFSAALLALGVTFSLPAAAQGIETQYAPHLYVTDPTKPIEIYVGGPYGWSNPGYVNIPDPFGVYIAVLDINGNMIDADRHPYYGGWVPIFMGSGCTGTNCLTKVEPFFRVPLYNSLFSQVDINTYQFILPEGAYEIVFKWEIQPTSTNIRRTYYSGGNFAYAEFTKENVALRLHSGQVTDYSAPQSTWQAGHMASHSVNLKLTNVQSSPPVIPEPETYAMMLAGLGVIGAVTRRRRNKPVS